MAATCNVFPVTRHNTTIPSFPLGAVFAPTGSEISCFQTAERWWRKIATRKIFSFFTSEPNVESNQKIKKKNCHRHFKVKKVCLTLWNFQSVKTRKIYSLWHLTHNRIITSNRPSYGLPEMVHLAVTIDIWQVICRRPKLYVGHGRNTLYLLVP